MKQIARWVFRTLARRVLRRGQPVVIAIAGSVGKTATKEAIAAGITNGRTVRQTQGNFNAEIGVPVTIISGGERRSSVWQWLRIVVDGLAGGRPSAYPSTLVLELGADHPGDLGPLLELTTPQIGVLTSVAPEHLEFFGDEQGVVVEESLVVRRLAPTATAILNADDPKVLGVRDQLACRVVTYGWHSDADIRAVTCSVTRNDRGLPDGLVVTVQVHGHTLPIALPGVIGRHQAYPILAALAVGRALGDDPVTVSQRLSAYQPPPGRMRLLEGRDGSVIIDDSYNASPAAVLAALETLAELDIPGHRLAILGQMSELGAAAAEWHDRIGQAVAQYRVDQLVTVGPLADRIGKAAIQAGFKADHVHNVATAEAAASIIQPELHSGDAVLLKGSRFAARLEKAVSLLLAHPDRDRRLLVHSS